MFCYLQTTDSLSVVSIYNPLIFLYYRSARLRSSGNVPRVHSGTARDAIYNVAVKLSDHTTNVHLHFGLLV